MNAAGLLSSSQLSVHTCAHHGRNRLLKKSFPQRVTVPFRRFKGKAHAAKNDPPPISQHIANLKRQLQELESEKREAFEIAQTFSRRSKNLLARAQQLTEYALEKVSQGDEESARATLQTKVSIKGALEKATAKASINYALAQKLDDVIGQQQQVLLQLLASAKELPLEPPPTPISRNDPPARSQPSSAAWSSETLAGAQAPTNTNAHPHTTAHNTSQANASPLDSAQVFLGPSSQQSFMDRSALQQSLSGQHMPHAQLPEFSNTSNNSVSDSRSRLPTTARVSYEQEQMSQTGPLPVLQSKSQVAVEDVLVALSSLLEKARAHGGSVTVEDLEQLQQQLRRALGEGKS